MNILKISQTSQFINLARNCNTDQRGNAETISFLRKY